MERMARGDVGAPLPLTGRYAVQGAQVRAGLELWARQTGARLVLLDDCSDPRQAARLHEDLVAGGCRFVLGPYGSDSTRAVARARAGRVVWNHGAAADDVQRLPGVVSVPSPASRYLVALGRAVARLSPGAHVAVEGAPGRFACEELQREAAVLGLRLVPKPTKADAVLYCGPLEWELARFRLREPGLLLGGVSPGLAAFAQLLGDDPEGPLAPVQWHPDLRVESELGPVTGSRSTSPPRPTQLASSPSAVSSSNPRTRSPSRGVSARPRSSAASNSVRTASRWGITSRPSSGAGAAASFCSRTPSGSAGDSQEGVALLRSDDGRNASTPTKWRTRVGSFHALLSGIPPPCQKVGTSSLTRTYVRNRAVSTVWKGSTRRAVSFLSGSGNASPAAVPESLLAITSSIHPSPATVCGKPIVVRASRPTWRTSSEVMFSASARRACDRTAHSACAPIATPSLTRRALRASRGPPS
ncbi:MAG: hypothetical protein E6G20_11785 [Actinobacteria bacterium]|nr:MAG: hypothetical protein E6G20_11785 [Actinomycetota bacterium]